MAEQVDVLAVGDFAVDHVADDVAHQRIRPAVDVTRIAAGREHAAVVVAFDAGPDLVGERQRHDQQLVLVGRLDPEVAVFVAVAQHAVLHDDDRAVRRVAVGTVRLQLGRTIGVAVFIHVQDGVAARMAHFNGDAVHVGHVGGFHQALASFR
ncbi:hypothetical protein G6F58_013048 [Rhizopus delemar]|nr:hypothetical protein G6F58_013048 [Rhizopus delemar]